MEVVGSVETAEYFSDLPEESRGAEQLQQPGEFTPADGGALSGATAAPEPKLYISNLPFTVTDEDLAELFAPFGQVQRVLPLCLGRGARAAHVCCLWCVRARW